MSDKFLKIGGKDEKGLASPFNLDQGRLSTVSEGVVYMNNREYVPVPSGEKSHDLAVTRVLTQFPKCRGMIKEGNFLYVVGGDSTGLYNKIDVRTGEVVASRTRSTEIYCLAVDSSHVYYASTSYGDISKVNKNDPDDYDVIRVLEGVVSRISSLAVDDTHIYVGGLSGDLVKIDKVTLAHTLVATSAMSRELVIDDEFVYLATRHANINGTVEKRRKSDLERVFNTHPVPNFEIYSIVYDGNHVYTIGSNSGTITSVNGRVRKYTRDNLSLVAESEVLSTRGMRGLQVHGDILICSTAGDPGVGEIVTLKIDKNSLELLSKTKDNLSGGLANAIVDSDLAYISSFYEGYIGTLSLNSYEGLRWGRYK